MRTHFPTAALTHTRGNLDQLFDRFFDDFRSFGAGGEGRGLVRLDVAEYADRYVVRAELPGLAPADLELSLEGGTLTLAGTKGRAFADESEHVLHRESGAGAFRRLVEFPLPVDAEGVRARHEHGVVFVDVPKSQVARARKIEIQAPGQ
jgi:HSP20 family protein